MVVVKNSQPRQKEYVAAVVEYSPVLHSTPQKTISENAKQYQSIIRNARQYDVDIIVFPEAGLTGVHIPSDRNAARDYLIELPSPEQKIIPYLDHSRKWSQLLQKLSYAASENHMYVAVNLLEICYCAEDDTDCPEDGAYFYNTNIAFDRKGAVIARYRKYNLFIEKAFNSPKVPDLCTFETDFGVTFGMFICFDIMFVDPSVTLVRKKNVTDIVYSTAWFSELPLLTAIQVQSAWAYSMDVNLLAAGYNNPRQTGGGSGIYAGTKGPLVVFMPGESGTQILIARVPQKKAKPSDIELDVDDEENLVEINNNRRGSFILPASKTPKTTFANHMTFLRDLSLDLFTVESLDNKFNVLGNVTNKLTYSGLDFECDIEVTWFNDGKYNEDFAKYKLIAYSGDRNFSSASVNHIEVCGLVMCADIDRNSCGFIPDFGSVSEIPFVSVKIHAKSYTMASIPVPSTLDSTMYPLPVSDFTFATSITNEDGRDVYNIEMDLVKPVSNLLAFAIYKLPSDPSMAHKSVL